MTRSQIMLYETGRAIAQGEQAMANGDPFLAKMFAHVAHDTRLLAEEAIQREEMENAERQRKATIEMMENDPTQGDF